MPFTVSIATLFMHRGVKRDLDESVDTAVGYMMESSVAPSGEKRPK